MREWLVAAWIVTQKNTPCEDFLSLLRGCLQISILVFLFLQNRLHWILCCWCWYSREKVSQELVYLNGGRHNVCVLIILEGCLTAMEVLSVVEWLIQNFDKWKVAGSIPVRHGNFFFKYVELLAVASPCSKGKTQSSFISEIWTRSLRVTTNIPLGTGAFHLLAIISYLENIHPLSFWHFLHCIKSC